MITGGHACHLFALFAACISILTGSVNSLSPSPKCVIKICHNKDCTKKGGGEALLQTFRDLLPSPSSLDNVYPTEHVSVSIESAGCLSQCGRGPNVSVMKDGKEEKKYFGVTDATAASAVLEVATGEEYPISLLVAASVISQAEHGQFSK